MCMSCRSLFLLFHLVIVFNVFIINVSLMSTFFFSRVINAINFRTFVTITQLLSQERKRTRSYWRAMLSKQKSFGQHFSTQTRHVLWRKTSERTRQHNDQMKKEKQRSTRHTHKTKDLVTGTPLKTGSECYAKQTKKLRPTFFYTNPSCVVKKDQRTYTSQFSYCHNCK
jgi:hypothetical protein